MSVEFVGIELELRGEEGVYNDLKKIDSVINSLRGKKKLDMGLNTLKRDLVAARGELEKLQRERTKLLKAEKEAQRAANAEMTRMNNLYNKWGSGFKNSAASKFLKDNVREANRARLEAEKAVQGNAAAIDAAKMRVKDLNQAMREVQASARAMGKTFQQSFNRANSVITHIGSKMQSLGNAMTRLTSPFQRLTTGLLYGAGYKALNMITEGFSGAFERADTMNKYTKLMKEYETANYSAIESRNELDESVQGLPIALNDAIALAQRYTLSLGDMEKGTKLAIATNNAFLASMATETQRYQGMLQLQDLMNGKDLQPREWMSLGSSMGKAINEIGKELGYSTDQLGEFRQELYAGNIATEDFLNALIKVGTGKGSLVGLAKLSAETWEGLFANVKIAAARMGASIIETLNDTFKKATGRSLLQTLLGLDAQGNEVGGGIKHWINDLSSSVQNWIKANPDKIIDFFNDLKSIDWKGLIKGFAQGMGDLANLIRTMADLFSGKDLSKFGRNLIRMSILGRGLTILGGVLKGTSGLFATVYATTKTLKRAKGAGSLLDAIGVLLGDKGGDIGKAAEKATKAGGSMGKFSLGLSKIFKGWAEIATMIGGSAFVAWGSMKLFKGAFKELGEITEIISEIDWATGGNALLMMADWVVALAGVGNLIMKSGLAKDLGIGMLVTGLMTTFASATFFADMALIKKGFKAIADATKHINTAIANLEKVKEIPEGVVGKVESVMGVFNQITELLAIERNNPVTGEGTGGLKELDKKSARTIKNLANALKNMVSGIKSLNAINEADIDISNIQDNMDALGEAVESIGTMLEDMPTTLKGEQSQTWSENVKVALANVHDAFKSLTAGDGILTQLPMITSAIHQINLDTVKTEFKKLGDVMDEIQGNLEGVGSDMTFAKRISNFRAALKSMKYAIGHLNQIGQMEVNPQGAENIKSALKQLGNAFDDAGMENITTQIQDFVKSIDDALKQFDKFNKTIVLKTKVKLGGGFSSSVSAAVSKIRKAGRDIQSAVDSIPSEITKNVTVRIVVNAIVSGMDKVRSVAQEALSAAGKANGGMIYRSNGGSIYRANGGGIGFPGKPQGADRIPVWAQAGEFMHSKRAVNFFGIDFMRKVNSLDMKGAMDELMIRAGNMVGAGQSTTINNYNYNNNQKVVQNINTNSPDFAFRTASRFVGAF